MTALLFLAATISSFSLHFVATGVVSFTEASTMRPMGSLPPKLLQKMRQPSFHRAAFALRSLHGRATSSPFTTISTLSRQNNVKTSTHFPPKILRSNVAVGSIIQKNILGHSSPGQIFTLFSSSSYSQSHNPEPNEFYGSMPTPNGAYDNSYSHSIITDELNSSQKEATLRPRYSITRVVAGPGAGKTRVLTCRIAHLLLSSSSAATQSSGGGIMTVGDEDDFGNGVYQSSAQEREGILAVTFTKKAAMEMQRRLTDLLVQSTKPTGTDRLTIPVDGDGELIQENADPNDPIYQDESTSISDQLVRRTTLGTFHSVCSKILRKFGRELGDLPSVRDCIGYDGLRDTNARRDAEDSPRISVSGDEEEYAAVEGAALTLDGSFNILDQSDQLRLLKDILKEYHIDLKGSGPALGGKGSATDIRPITVLNAISLLNTEEATAPQHGNDKEESSRLSRKVKQIATTIRRPFQKAKYEQNSLDFDDLILLTRELLLHYPEAREILHRRWRHILVDEFQDTSQVQLDLVRLLTTNSLFIVGDGDQSIYSWRGASPQSMSDFEVAFHDRMHGWEGLLNHHNEDLVNYFCRICGSPSNVEPLKVSTVFLMENYRSTTNIVKAAQKVIGSTEDKGRGSSSSSNRLPTPSSIRQDMKPMRGEGPSPRVLACKDAKAEANFVVKTVNSMVESGELLPSSTVAMIYRTNAQSRVLEEACVEHNLRYVVRGSSGTFYKRAEIQDCMSFLKIFYNGRDRSALARAVKAPSRGIGDASLTEFFNYCDSVVDQHLRYRGGTPPTPMDVLLSLAPTNSNKPAELLVPPKDFMSTRSLNRFIPFASSLALLREKAEKQSVPDFLMSVVEDLDLKQHLDSISKTRDEYEDRLSNVMELIRAADRYKSDGACIQQSPEGESMDTPLGNFLDDVALIADIDPDDNNSEGSGRIIANLMTIHSSKGMEFDCVFLVGNEEGTFPTQKSIGEGEGSVELSEERRLCYVAMTRAKTHLILTWRREVSFFSGSTLKTKDVNRSRFLDVLVAKQGVKHKKSPQISPATRGRNVVERTRPTHGQASSVPKRQYHSSAKTNSVTKQMKSSWDNWDPSQSIERTENIPTVKRLDLDNRRRQAQSPRPKQSPTKRSPQATQRSTTQRNYFSTFPGDRKIQMPPSERNNDSLKQSTDRRSSRTVYHSTLDKRSNKREVRSFEADPPPPNDSTLFYPVGSTVQHNWHGRGVVQPPPIGDINFTERLLVRVMFSENNFEIDMPMDSLRRIYNDN